MDPNTKILGEQPWVFGVVIFGVVLLVGLIATARVGSSKIAENTTVDDKAAQQSSVEQTRPEEVADLTDEFAKLEKPTSDAEVTLIDTPIVSERTELKTATSEQASTPTPASIPPSDRESMLVILKENASTKWGDNYQMVKYEYDNQVSAYDWVVAQSKYPDIMNGAIQKWGNNFQMVEYEYENQLEAYEWILAQTDHSEIMAKAKQIGSLRMDTGTN